MQRQFDALVSPIVKDEVFNLLNLAVELDVSQDCLARVNELDFDEITRREGDDEAHLDVLPVVAFDDRETDASDQAMLLA